MRASEKIYKNPMAVQKAGEVSSVALDAESPPGNASEVMAIGVLSGRGC
jgi:hypothetical protein